MAFGEYWAMILSTFGGVGSIWGLKGALLVAILNKPRLCHLQCPATPMKLEPKVLNDKLRGFMVHKNPKPKLHIRHPLL